MDTIKFNQQLIFNQSLIWITMINYGYINFTKNFLESMKIFKSKFKLIIYCIDQQSIDALKDYDYCICINAKVFLKYDNLPSELQSWNDINYKKITFSKLDCILYTLKLLSKINVTSIGYIDTDIVVLSDPTNIILKILEENIDIKIFAQCDEQYINCPSGNCNNKYNCRNICSGIIIFRNVEDIYHIFEYDENDIQKFSGDQDLIRHKVFKYKIPNLSLDKKIFLNGVYPGLNNKIITFPNTTCLIHFNYIVGKDKEQKMKDKKFWFIN
jgi:hypothetical protein